MGSSIFFPHLLVLFTNIFDIMFFKILFQVLAVFVSFNFPGVVVGYPAGNGRGPSRISSSDAFLAGVKVGMKRPDVNGRSIWGDIGGAFESVGKDIGQAAKDVANGDVDWKGVGDGLLDVGKTVGPVLPLLLRSANTNPRKKDTNPRKKDQLPARGLWDFTAALGEELIDMI